MRRRETLPAYLTPCRRRRTKPLGIVTVVACL
jgi:hypothetical protein